MFRAMAFGLCVSAMIGVTCVGGAAAQSRIRSGEAGLYGLPARMHHLTDSRLAPRNSELTATQQPFDLRKLAEIQPPTAMPAPERIARCVQYLRDEVAVPSPDRWGRGGGLIDTGYVLAQILGALAFPGSEAPDVLRDYRDRETTPRIKDLLTISLAETGAQDTIPRLLELARNEKGMVRCEVLRALAEVATSPRPTDVPRRIRSGETWKPVAASVRDAVIAAIADGLEDPWKSYYGGRKDEALTGRPVQTAAAQALRYLGFGVKQVRNGEMVVGWRVLDTRGTQIRAVVVKEPFRRTPNDDRWQL